MWKDSYRIGIENIDNQHIELFARVDRLLNAIASQEDPSVYRQTIAFLKDYVVTHFRDEEAYQASINYIGMDAHVQAHRNFTAEVLGFERKLNESNYDLATVKELAGTLTSWLIYHVTNTDLRIAKMASVKPDTGSMQNLSYSRIFAKSAMQIIEKLAYVTPELSREFTTLADRFKGGIFAAFAVAGHLKGQIVFCYSRELALNLVQAMTLTKPLYVDELVCSAMAEIGNLACGSVVSALGERGFGIEVQKQTVVLSPNFKGRYDVATVKCDLGELDVAISLA